MKKCYEENKVTIATTNIKQKQSQSETEDGMGTMTDEGSDKAAYRS